MEERQPEEEEKMSTSTKSKSDQRMSFGSALARLLELAQPDKYLLMVSLGALFVSSSTNLLTWRVLGQAMDKASTDTGSEAARRVRGKSVLMRCAGVFAVGSVASWLRVYTLGVATSRIATRLRRRLFQILLRRTMTQVDLDGEVPAETLTTDVDTLAAATTEQLARLLRGLSSTCGGAFLLLKLSPKLTAAALSVIPIVGVSAMLRRRHQKAVAAKYKTEISAANAAALERLSLLRCVKLLAREEAEHQAYSSLLWQASKTASRNASSEGVFMGFTVLSVATSLLGVLHIGGGLVQSGELTVGRLASFVGYSAWVGLGAASLAGVASNTIKVVSASQNIFHLLDEDATRVDPGTELMLNNKGKNAGRDNDVIFENVTFAYPSRPDVNVLDGFSLKIPCGAVTALVGASGCGKSTVANLALRFYNAASGRILLGESSIDSLSFRCLRHNIALVEQRPTLFDVSIMENIRYGRMEATDDEVLAAAREAAAHDFISALPGGYGTVVGHRGVQLSGGQVQRIAIARALLRDPTVIILDEATSGLDLDSAWEALRSALEVNSDGRKRRAVLLIAHRPSTVKRAGDVAVMKDGMIVQQGRFEDLMKDADGHLRFLMDKNLREMVQSF